MSAFYRIVQIVECVVCEDSNLGTNAIVGFFFLNIFGLVLVNLGTMGLACVQKHYLLCVQSSSCDLCGELLEGIAYTIYVSTQSELHCMVMSKMHHMW